MVNPQNKDDLWLNVFLKLQKIGDKPFNERLLEYLFFIWLEVSQYVKIPRKITKKIVITAKNPTFCKKNRINIVDNDHYTAKDVAVFLI